MVRLIIRRTLATRTDTSLLSFPLTVSLIRVSQMRGIGERDVVGVVVD